MKKLIVASILLIGICIPWSTSMGKAAISKGKVLFVDSYHAGYPWSEGIITGVKETLSLEEFKNRTELKIIRMDTKRNKSEDFKKDAALKVKALIHSWQPDVVIAADDNASKYVIVPYFKDATLPFVFCGVNWDASNYGFPCSNITGMVEVSLIPQLLEQLKIHAKGNRVGFLGADNLSNRKEAENYKKIFNIDLKKEMFVNNFEELKSAFKQIQEDVDMVILAPPSFLKTDAEKRDAETFFMENTIIPTGSVEAWITPYTLMGYTKIAQEQGAWAAQKAIEILNGEAPSDIPIVKNKKAKIFLNMKIAKKMGIKFPIELIDIATFTK